VADSSPASRTYACSTGEISIDVRTEEQWHSLAVCLGRPELAYTGAWDVVQQADADGPTARVLEEMFAEDTAESWLTRLRAHDVPCEMA
jgi:crotonobetainyl-CoA:carnitine CoA-transferase CaiB-like acyl-CoA transferase